MSEFYLQFSTGIDNLTNEEVEWVQEHLGVIEAWNKDEIEEGSKQAKRLAQLADLYGFEDEHDTLAFEWKLEDSENRGKFLWIYANDQGDPDHVIAFVQAFLIDNRPKDAFAFSWSITCTPPTLGEFGGGAAFVTAMGYEHVDVWTWSQRKLKAFQEQQKGAT